MALTKPTLISLLDTDFPYLRIDRIVYIDQLARNAEFNVRAYLSQASATKAGVQGVHVGVIRFTADAFDLYFSKSALKAAASDVYAQAYQAAKDWSAAIVIKRVQEQLVAAANLAVTNANIALQNLRRTSTAAQADLDAATATLATAQSGLSAATATQAAALSPNQVSLMWHAFVSGVMGEQLFVGATDA